MTCDVEKKREKKKKKEKKMTPTPTPTPRFTDPRVWVPFFTLAYIDERICCNPGCFSAGKCMANCAAARICLAESCIANSVWEKPKQRRQSQFMSPTAGERARQLAAGETNRLAHHQNLEVKSFYSDPARRNVGVFLLKWNVSLT